MDATLSQIQEHEKLLSVVRHPVTGPLQLGRTEETGEERKPA